MTTLNTPCLRPFISSFSLQPLGNYPDVLLLEARFSLDHFDESLFDRLKIPAPTTLWQAVKKRRAEYLVSRYCLQQAMTHFGIRQFVLHNDASRAPIWPQGIRGSLTHSHQRVCALLTRRTDLLPGIDCEQILTPQIAHEIADRVISVAEKQYLLQLSLPFSCALTVVFSLKESLYKTIWPQLQQFMDFTSAEVVSYSPDMQQARLRLTRTFSAEFYAGREFIAQAAIQPDEVLTWIIGQRKFAKYSQGNQ